MQEDPLSGKGELTTGPLLEMKVPDWTSLEPELLARICRFHHSGEFSLTCSRWRAVANASTERLRFTYVPDNEFQDRGVYAEELSILGVRFPSLKVLEIEILDDPEDYYSWPYSRVVLPALDRLKSLAALTVFKVYRTSPAGSDVRITDATPYVRPRLLPEAIKELDVRCSLPQGMDHLTALAALRNLTQLSFCVRNRIPPQNATFAEQFRYLEDNDHLSKHLARLSICTGLRALEVGMFYGQLQQDYGPQILKSSVSRLTALHGLQSLTLVEHPLAAASIGQALSALTGLTCLRLTIGGNDLGSEVAEIGLGPLRALGELQQLAIKVQPFSPPQLPGGQSDVGLFSVLATLPGALQLCVSIFNFAVPVNAQSLFGLTRLESLTWQTSEYLSENEFEELGRLPLTALHLTNGNSETPYLPHQVACFAAGCRDLGRLVCLSVEQNHAFSALDLEALQHMTSLTSLKLAQMRHADNKTVRQLIVSADTAAIDHISLLTNLKRLDLGKFPSMCDDNLRVLHTLKSLQYLKLKDVRLTMPSVNELTMLSSLRAISVVSNGCLICHQNWYEDAESLLTGLSVLEKLCFVKASVVSESLWSNAPNRAMGGSCWY